jgi:mannose-6-phosphate isomerase-like protein (cupin superfamily)
MQDNFVRQTNKKEISVTKIVTVLYLENSRDFVFGGESHDFWEFDYIDKGIMAITVDGKEYLLRSGEMVFFQPNEFHSLEARGQSAPNHTVVSFVSNSTAMQYFKN